MGLSKGFRIMQRPQEQKHCSKQSLQRTELAQPFPLPLSHSRPIVKLCLKTSFTSVGLELPLYKDQQHKATGIEFCMSTSTLLFPPHSTSTTSSLIRDCLLLFRAAYFSCICLPHSFRLLLELQTVLPSFRLPLEVQTVLPSSWLRGTPENCCQVTARQ